VKLRKAARVRSTPMTVCAGSRGALVWLAWTVAPNSGLSRSGSG
jgi:hypothetical protein